MSEVCAKSVVAHLASTFGLALPFKISDCPLNEEEKKWHDRLSLILKCAESGEISVRERNELTRNDSDMEEDEEEWNFEDEEKPKKIEITKKMLDDALLYYRSCKQKINSRKQGVRSLNAMSKRFRWITSQANLNLLAKYEKTGRVLIRRNEQLEKLALELDRDVEQVINEGKQFSDFELREMALSINRQKGFWPNFKCSESWVLNWKKKFRVSSRRVTEFVSTKNDRNTQKTLELVDDLRKRVADLVNSNPGIEIWNTDQTGLVKECHGARTLARTGTKKIRAVVQSKSATSHSITLLPIIGSNGYQHDKMFVQLGEANGKLPKKGCYSDPTIEVAVQKSHIMSRETAGQFFKNVLFGGRVPPKLILILDSWPVFKDHAFIRSFAPPNVELHIMNIPPGGTSICQPADLSYNHQVKGIQKKVTTLVMFRGIKYRISERDNLLKFASQVHWVLGSPRFEPFISYGFFKGGFTSIKPPQFEGPKQFIFGPRSFDPCSCTQEGFSVCPRCNISFCFNCFWVDLHRC